jgi:hypothetical protein
MKSPQGLYSLVVYGLEFACSLLLQHFHEQYKAKLQPTWDWVFIIAGVVLSVSTTGIRVRMLPRISDDADLSRAAIEERAYLRYEGGLVRAFSMSGVVVIVWALIRSVLWKAETEKFAQKYVHSSTPKEH